MQRLAPYLKSLKLWYGVIFASLLVWYGFWLASRISLTVADLGRHLMNGGIIVTALRQHSWVELNHIIHTNFYSFTATEFSFINHHWGSGVFFYMAHYLGGWVGLSIFFIVLNLATFSLIFDIAWRRAGFMFAATVAVFVIPLVAERVEIRPEAFSYFFVALFWWLWTQYRAGKLSYRQLWCLPLLQILWANLHIYFFLGPLVLGIFFLQEWLTSTAKTQTFRQLFPLWLTILLAGAVTPFGLTGLLYPLTIFKNYGFLVKENQPGWLLAQNGWHSANFITLKIMYSTGAAALLGLLMMRRRRELPVGETLLVLLFGWLAWQAVRNYTLFALFALPWLALILHLVVPPLLKHFSERGRTIVTSGLSAIILVGTVVLHLGGIAEHWNVNFGLGLMPGTHNLADFVNQHNIRGPLLNDFDIGSYLIYYLYPRERVFADNRPEAYPANFFQDIFIPMQTDEGVWHQKMATYNLRALIFSFDDQAPWMLPFIIKRLNDPEWAPVYADKFGIVFVKRDTSNADLIKQFEIPKEKFGLTTVPETN